MALFNSSKDERRVQDDGGNINNNNIIAKGTIIKGDIESAGNMRIDGKLIGNIRSKAKVALGNGSKVEGNIYAQNAEIEGEVVGIIEIADVLVLKPTAVILGDIYTTRLVVESGAKFNGSCKMGEQSKEARIETGQKQAKTA